MKKLLVLALVLGAITGQAQKKKQQDTEAILSMCGCYDITFNFSETFSPKVDYTFHDKYKSGGLELVIPIIQEKDKIVLQHLLIINDSTIIKHWRQDWLYENTDLLLYHKDYTWKFASKTDEEVKGQWTQKVFQVDDSPRYEASATWVHSDGRHYWESTADAPLPRREITKRSDYNVLRRTNHQEITDYGWMHEEDNDKVVRSEGKDELIASEKGWNTYVKTGDAKCDPARKWWAANQTYWADVRAVWDEVFAKKGTLTINMKVEDVILFQRLFDLGDEASKEKYDSAETRSKIKSIINLHLQEESKLASK